MTLRDIAKAVGVTTMTVSRALRSQDRVSESLRQKIQEKARELGYRPDPMLAALQHYRHAKDKRPICAELGWINWWPDPKKLRSFNEFELYWRGAFNEAERSGYRLEEFVINSNIRPERLQQILITRNIRGLLLPPAPHGAMIEWREFPWREFAIVRFGYSIQNPRSHLVTSDHLSNSMLACEKIFQKGYKQLGLVTSVRSHVRLAAGYLYTQMQRSAKVGPLPLVLAQKDRAEDQRQLVKWLEKNKPDAIFTDVGELREMIVATGLRVPADIGLATMSVLDGNADAGIDQNSEVIGRAAVQLLVSLVNHRELGVPTVCREELIEGRWVDGSTLPSKNTLPALVP